MALITCPECKKEVSDKAASCPGCGYPLNVAQKPEKQEGVELQCPDFPVELSIGKPVTSRLGDCIIKINYNKNENAAEIMTADKLKMIPPNGNIKIELHQHGIKFSVIMGISVLDIHSSQLISLKETSTQEIIQTDKSIIGRAVVGGLLLGPLGAVIGGMSGVNKNKMKNESILVINFWNTQTRKAESLILRSEMKVTQFVNKVKAHARENGWMLEN